MKISASSVTIILGVLFSLLLTVTASHPLQAVLGVGIKTIFLLTAVSLAFYWLYLRFARSQLRSRFLPDVGIALLVSIVLLTGSLVSQSLHQAQSGGVFLVLFFLIVGMRETEIFNVMSRVLSMIALLILVLSIISFVYALMGFAPSAVIQNPETGKNIYLYGTSFTNHVVGFIIRPAGIFDEPGALAMYTILVCCASLLRNGKNERSEKTEILLLTLNCITFSLMAFAALILYFFCYVRGFRNWLIGSFASIMFFGGVYFYNQEVISDLIFARLEFSEGGFSGDNRSSQIEAVLGELNLEIALKGYQVLYGNYTGGIDIASSNPLSILFTSGIFLYLVYVFLLLYLILKASIGDKKIRFVGLVLFLLLLQRPYVFSMYWSGLIVMTVIMFAFYKQRTRTPV